MPTRSGKQFAGKRDLLQVSDEELELDTSYSNGNSLKKHDESPQVLLGAASMGPQTIQQAKRPRSELTNMRTKADASSSAEACCTIWDLPSLFDEQRRACDKARELRVEKQAIEVDIHQLRCRLQEQELRQKRVLSMATHVAVEIDRLEGQVCAIKGRSWCQEDLPSILMAAIRAFAGPHATAMMNMTCREFRCSHCSESWFDVPAAPAHSRMFCLGVGDTGRVVEVYNALRDRWEAVGSLSCPLTGNYSFAVPTVDQDSPWLLAAYSFPEDLDAENAAATVHRYDATKEAWSGSAAPIGPNLEQLCNDSYDWHFDNCTSMAGGSKTAIFHGRASMGLVLMNLPPGPDPEIQRVQCPAFFEDSCVAERNGIVYVLGGYAGNREMQTMKSVWAYTIETQQWNQLTPMTTARAEATAAWLKGKLYVVGGVRNPQNRKTVLSAEAYDPGTDSWTDIATISEPAYVFGSVAAAMCGKLYLFYFDSRRMCVWSYDTETGNWQQQHSSPTVSTHYTSSQLAVHI